MLRFKKVLFLMLLLSLTLFSAGQMEVLFEKKVEEKAINVNKNKVWKSYSFVLPADADVVITIWATARDNGRRDDDDLKWSLDREDFGWATEYAWDGRELRGNKKKVVVEKRLLAGKHSINFWANQNPTLHSVVVETEAKTIVEGPKVKESEYLENIGVKLSWESVDSSKGYVIFRKDGRMTK